MSSYDVVVVGARCAGSITAGLLARSGAKVLLIDKATFPSDTISTHMMFPNTVARFEELGILERLVGRHEIPFIYLRWRILGFELSGRFTPVQGHELGTSIRRIALDAVLVEWAADAGATCRFGEAVVELLREGDDDQHVKGVVVAGGEEIRAKWVVGADGRASKIASLLRLEKENPLVGDMGYLISYWRGLPPAEFGTLDVDGERSGLMRTPCEDGIDLISVAGPPEITRGSGSEREKRFAAGVRAFPESFDPAWLEGAERVSDLVVVPEPMMRGFFRQATGPGWVLVGDSGHFKHPGTAQGISDAVEQGVYVAEALQGADPELAGFADWRRKRSRGHYEWSFVYGSWPVPEVTTPYMSGLSSSPDAVQDWLDTFTRNRTPAEVNTPERLGTWMSSAGSEHR